jgi:membrane glycosyltransferase
VLSSRSSLGLKLKHWGLFLTPEETRPPAELRRLRRALNRGLDAGGPPTGGEGQSEEENLAPEENGTAMAHAPWPEKKPMVPDGVRDIA